MSVTKHIDLKTKNLKTKSHIDTTIRIKLLGSERCPMSSVDLSPAVQDQPSVEKPAEVLPWKEWERDPISARGGRAHGEQLCGVQQPWSGPRGASGRGEPPSTRPPPVAGASRPTGPAAAPTAAACR